MSSFPFPASQSNVIALPNQPLTSSEVLDCGVISTYHITKCVLILNIYEPVDSAPVDRRMAGWSKYLLEQLTKYSHIEIVIAAVNMTFMLCSEDTACLNTFNNIARFAFR
jgi:hypothetical protein